MVDALPVQQTPPIMPHDQRKEWDSYEGSKTQGVMKSEFDQKVYLIDVDKRIDFKNLITLVTKELDTSFINDQNLKIFYQINFENILEWANMGLEDLAKIRLSKLFAELKLEKSVGGFERILQGATLTGQVSAPLPAKKGLFPIEFLRRHEGPRTVTERVSEAAQG
jgi:hypothetical protein